MVEESLFKRNFILLWAGQAVSQLGGGVGYIATLWWVQSTTGSALALGGLVTISSMVGLVLSPIAGVFVDRWNRKYIIVGTDIIRGVVNCLLAWALWQNQLTLPLLFAGTAIKSACGQFFSPAIMAAIPQIVPSKQLEKANSLQQITQTITGMSGYALGGLLAAVVGIPALFLVNGLAYLVSAFSELFISLQPVMKASKLSLQTVLGDLADGLTYVKGDRVLFGIMQVAIIINFAFVPFTVLLPKLVSDYLGAGSEVLGFITSAQMAGMFLGAILLSVTSLVKRSHWLVKLGLAISALCLMLSPLARGGMWPLQLLLYGVSGVVTAIVQIFFFSTLQRKIDPAYMGKVFSLNSAMSFSLQPLAGTLSGYLADQYSLVPIYFVFGLLVILANLRFLLIPGLDAYFGFKGKQTPELAAYL